MRYANVVSTCTLRRPGGGANAAVQLPRARGSQARADRPTKGADGAPGRNGADGAQGERGQVGPAGTGATPLRFDAQPTLSPTPSALATIGPWQIRAAGAESLGSDQVNIDACAPGSADVLGGCMGNDDGTTTHTDAYSTALSPDSDVTIASAMLNGSHALERSVSTVWLSHLGRWRSCT